MQCQERLEAYLQEHQVLFQLQHHAQSYHAQSIARYEHIPDTMVAKSVLLFADQKMFMLVLPASLHVDLDKIQEVLQAKEVRLAHEAEFAAIFPDCEIGAMPPFGNLYHVPVYVEERLSQEKMIVFSAGTHTDTMRVTYADFASLVQPQVATFAKT